MYKSILVQLITFAIDMTRKRNEITALSKKLFRATCTLEAKIEETEE